MPEAKKKSSKGLIIGVVLALGFVLLTCGGGGGFAFWKFYWQPRQEAKKALDAMMGEATPTPDPMSTSAPSEESPTPMESGAATSEPTMSPDTQVADATSEPTSEPSAPPAETRPPAPKKTKAPKTAAPATPSPTDEPTEAPKAKPRKQAFEISHVHGGFSKKACTGTIELTDTGFKYDATSSEDDRQDHVEYRFDQIKKVEQKDYKNAEVAAVDKKWTFRGEGLTLAKLVAHLNAHSKEFASK